MSCIVTRCCKCKGVFMSNVIYKVCPGCKLPGVQNDFDEQATLDEQVELEDEL